MIGLFTVLIVIACIVLSFFVLVQSPKGGGLAGNFGSISTQVMGVKQSSDVMEKGTWASIAVIAVLCIALVAWGDKAPKAPVQQQQQQQAPATGAPAAPATTPAPAPAPAQ